MSSVSAQEAADEFLNVLQRVEAGEEVVIQRAGQPIARLIPISTSEPSRKPRRIGLLRGQGTVPDDFDDPLPQEVLDAFYGR